jgi:hypothetical protein
MSDGRSHFDQDSDDGVGIGDDAGYGRWCYVNIGQVYDGQLPERNRVFGIGDGRDQILATS